MKVEMCRYNSHKEEFVISPIISDIQRVSRKLTTMASFNQADGD
jgi:hypothetical protein